MTHKSLNRLLASGVVGLVLMVSTHVQAYWTTKEVSHYDNAGKNGCRICCGRTSNLHLTASGKRPKVGVTIASNEYPFGTRIFLSGIGWRTVQDRLADPKNKRLDLYVESHSVARRLGVKKLKVYIERKPK